MKRRSFLKGLLGVLGLLAGGKLPEFGEPMNPLGSIHHIKVPKGAPRYLKVQYTYQGMGNVTVKLQGMDNETDGWRDLDSTVKGDA